MNITEKKLSTHKLSSSKEYREAFVAAFLKRYIPFQVRTIRKKRQMSQQQLAVASSVTQGVISRAEDPDYGNLTFNTVLRIAAGFDLAFVGKFVRFSELLKVADEMTEDAFDLPRFMEECKSEQLRTQYVAANNGVHGEMTEETTRQEPNKVVKIDQPKRFVMLGGLNPYDVQTVASQMQSPPIGTVPSQMQSSHEMVAGQMQSPPIRRAS